MKYVVIEDFATASADMESYEFDDLQEAIDKADRDWNYLTDREKKRCDRFFVLESSNPDEDADDHFDGNEVYTLK